MCPISKTSETKWECPGGKKTVSVTTLTQEAMAPFAKALCYEMYPESNKCNVKGVEVTSKDNGKKFEVKRAEWNLKDNPIENVLPPYVSQCQRGSKIWTG